ncbi:FAD-dependent oxidoreductase (plasmid) [Rhizobium sp. 32-5/1]|uniref:FAD-dependent oxidoreductase n=1 Tax=Rhizobium sp. 32-5/1 TaxID=3019602 RepID=UPI00240D457D|nr:FAD-dependent oxidoreductase [Rhizobium sp. 32-5/1]WEZ85364.1 FAD-dependent oxidoreductase [Rhizobium sp. 32-5/1]
MQKKYEVVIVGGGPVGMTLAYDLGMRGISCLVVDDGHPSLAKKAGSCNTRTMEYLRALNLSEKVKAAAPIPLASRLMLSLLPEWQARNCTVSQTA